MHALEKEIAIHSGIPAESIPGTEEPGGLLSMGSHDWSDLAAVAAAALIVKDFASGSDSKETSCNARDLVSISGLGRSPGEEHGNLLQYSWLENPKDRGAWQAIVPGIAKNWTQLSDFHFASLHWLWKLINTFTILIM